MNTAECIKYHTDILLKTVSFEVLLIRDSMFFSGEAPFSIRYIDIKHHDIYVSA